MGDPLFAFQKATLPSDPPIANSDLPINQTISLEPFEEG